MISAAQCMIFGAVLIAGINGHELGYECREVPSAPSGICADYFSQKKWHGRFPNRLGLDMDDSVIEFFHFFALIYQDNYCSHMLLNLLCFQYFPPCSSECPDISVTPSRQLCAEAVEACLPYARVLYGQMFETIFPQYLNCSNFGEANSAITALECSTNATNNTLSPCCSIENEVHLDCPNATLHVDFNPPIGGRVYQVLESAVSVEICMILANVGSYDPTSTTSGQVILKISTKKTENSFLPPADRDDDYEEPVATLTFPAGSVRGARRCIEVSIIDDYLKEGRESFSVEASPLPTTPATIGSNRARGSIEVIVIDDDEPFIPEEECRNKCGIRTRANTNTFSQNSYTYVARIEVMEYRDSSNYSSLLDVVILECWNLQSDVCPHGHLKYSIPVCGNCNFDFTSGEEYLIAGRHVVGAQRNGIYLPNYRKGGLFSTWKKSYSSVGEWVITANQTII